MIRDAAATPVAGSSPESVLRGRQQKINPKHHQQHQYYIQAEGRQCGLDVNNSRLTGVHHHSDQRIAILQYCFCARLLEVQSLQVVASNKRLEKWDEGEQTWNRMLAALSGFKTQLVCRRKMSDSKVSRGGSGCCHNDAPRKMGC
jgi:hypothetical protein